MLFNRKSLTINRKLKRNLRAKEYFPNRGGFKYFLIGYFTKKPKNNTIKKG